MTDSYAAGDGALSAQVPIDRMPSAYGKTDDLFAWACVAGLALALAASAFSYGTDRCLKRERQIVSFQLGDET